MLRMDDTDRERSRPEYEQAILRDMTWLGLTWDAYARQSERTDRYEQVLEELKAKGLVYPCYETQNELELKRKTQLGRGLPPVYDRAALKLSDADRAKLVAEGRKPHWRFKLTHEDVIWDDGVQGHKCFPAASLSDPVIVREDGVPLYTFSSVVDDADFGITHVIRGEDHVTNTAVQLQIWRGVTDKPVPTFAHFPLLVSASGIEMSKRLGTLSIQSMRDEDGIEAMGINALIASLGTSDSIAPHTSLEELAEGFSLEKISRSTPKFDMDELRHLSARVLHQMPYERIAERLSAQNLPGATAETLPRFWNAVHSNFEKFSDVHIWWSIAHGEIEPVVTDAAFLQTALSLLPEGPMDETTWGTWTAAIKTQTGRKGKDLFMPLRQALTGFDHGPEMKLFLPLMDASRVRARLSGVKG